MRYALVDNSTLTAAQRLLGHIEVANLYEIDGDILAFEGLLQAILFYDGVWCIDDYKVEHRSARHKLFPFVTFLDTSDFNYAELLRSAQESTETIMFHVRDGRITDKDFQRFFEMLRTQLIFTWEGSHSDAFLNIQMLKGQSGLSIEKYSALHEMINSQLKVRRESVRPPISKPDQYISQIVDVEGDPGEELAAFASSLNWISLRTAFYLLVAKSSSMEPVLHPIRHGFYLHLAEKLVRLPQAVLEPVVKMVRDGIESTVRSITSLSDPIVLQKQIPLFSAYLASRMIPPSEFLNEALHLREEGAFAEARKQLEDLEQTIANHDRGSFVREVNRLQQSITGTSARLLSEYGVSTPQGVPVSPLISVLNVPIKAKTGMSIPDFGWKIPLPAGLTRLRDAFGFKAVFRSVATDLVSIERLGELYERISSAVARREYATRAPVDSGEHQARSGSERVSTPGTPK